MNLHELLNSVERRKSRKRRGRGNSSGLGKSAGRGEKGAKARSGWRQRYGYEGGQMPLQRRIPKRGFNNVEFGTFFDVINTGVLENLFQDGANVDLKALVDRGALKPRYERLKILGDGDLKKRLNVVAHSASAEARRKIEAAGGTLTCLMPPRKVRKPIPVVRAAELAETKTSETKKSERKEKKKDRQKAEKEKAPGKESKEAKAKKGEPKGADKKGGKEE